MELRCNSCVHLKQDYCTKLNEVVPNGLAKLFYGGAEGIYAGTITYPSKCGIEKETEQKTNVEIGVLIPEVMELPKTQTVTGKDS